MTRMLRACSSHRLNRKRKRESSPPSSTPTLTEKFTVTESVETESAPADDGKKVIFILDNAAIKKAFIKKKWKIPRSTNDFHILRNQKKDVDDYRADIVHEALREILDSPLNKKGKVAAIYVKVSNGVLFEVKPHVRLPRTLSRFCGVMLDLLDKSCVLNKETREPLFRVVEEPVTQHLPANSRIIGISSSAQKLVDIENYVYATNENCLVFLIGTSVHGQVSNAYTNDVISISEYPLSARWRTGLVCEAFEQKWNIV